MPTAGWPYDVVTDELEAARVESVEEMRQIEGLRLERAIQAIWPQVLRGDLEAIETVLQIVRLEARLYGLDARPGLEAETEARPILIQVDGGDLKRLEELTNEELASYVASLESALDGDDPPSHPA